MVTIGAPQHKSRQPILGQTMKYNLTNELLDYAKPQKKSRYSKRLVL
jgi:hypothetical protein